jgi:hypothetical protein
MDTQQLHSYNTKFAPHMFKLTVSESWTWFWHYGRISSPLCGRKESSARLGKSFVRRYIQTLNVIDLQVRKHKGVKLVVLRALFYQNHYLLKCDGAKGSMNFRCLKTDHIISGYDTSLQVTWNSYPESRKGIFLRIVVLPTKGQDVRTQKEESSPKMNVGLFHK